RSTKHQIPTQRSRPLVWSLKFGASLELGIWGLELARSASHPRAADGASAAGTPRESFGGRLADLTYLNCTQYGRSPGRRLFTLSWVLNDTNSTRPLL